MKLKKHQLRWFISRIGHYVVLDNSISLFEPPVLISDKDHAKGLHVHQDRGHRYNLTLK